jgi:sulfate adenylyltransferase subunit 1
MNSTILNNGEVSNTVNESNLGHLAALKFITCGSVDDGKSTLIGRLLFDSKAVLQDHLAGIESHGEIDLAMLTDGLSAEREQGITIDVAYRYFSTESRKFIIGDTPGHEQYTRNMVTAASSADAAVVLIDATKLDWQSPTLELLRQTRRHSLLLKLLRVPSVIFTINKLDAIKSASLSDLEAQALAFKNISAAINRFATQVEIQPTALVPISALKGWNVVNTTKAWCDYSGPSLIQLLESLSNTPVDSHAHFSQSVQWVEKFHDSSTTAHGRRIFWGKVSTGTAKAGQKVKIFPGTQTAVIAQVLNTIRVPGEVSEGQSAGIILDKEVDISRGDAIIDADHPIQASREVSAVLAWMDDEPLVAGRMYHALHAHKWVKCKVQKIAYKIDINTLEQTPAQELAPNEIGQVVLVLQQEIPALKYSESRNLGAMILVDTASHRTSAAVLIS